MKRMLSLLLLAFSVSSVFAQAPAIPTVAQVPTYVPQHSWCGWSKSQNTRFRLTFHTHTLGDYAKFSAYSSPTDKSPRDMAQGAYRFKDGQFPQNTLVIMAQRQFINEFVAFEIDPATKALKGILKEFGFLVQCDDVNNLIFPQP